MDKPKKETYSTRKAWKTTETTNPQADVFHSLADGLRRENLLIKKMLDENEKKLTEQEIYIEQLEKKIESLETISREMLDERDFIRLFGTALISEK